MANSNRPNVDPELHGGSVRPVEIAEHIGIVVLDYSQAGLTVRCIDSVLRGCVLPSNIVVVENGAKTDIKSGATSGGANIFVLRAGFNLGCAGGRNLAIRFLIRNTNVRVIVSLDNDVVVPEDFISKIRAHPPSSVGVQFPVVRVSESSGIWSAGGLIHPRGEIEQLQTMDRIAAGNSNVHWGPGAAQIFTRETWAAVGPFDRWMNFLFEDIDWCVRVSTYGGFLTMRPDLFVDHQPNQSLGGADSPIRTWFWSRNGSVFVIWTLRNASRNLAYWYLTELRDLVVDVGHLRAKQVLARAFGLIIGTAEGIKRLVRTERNSN